MIDERPQGPEELLKHVWRFHIAEAIKRPSLAQAILARGQRLAWRFVHFYRRMRRQPRRTRRFLKIKLAGSLAAAALFLALSGTPAYAATITVDGTTCTLVDAIDSANTDTSVGGCATGSGADIIVMGGGTYTYAFEDNSSYGGNALPVVTTEITIEGNGSTIDYGSTPVDGADLMRALAISPDGDLTINDLEISSFESESSGGAIWNESGTLALNDSVISGNTANGIGGGIYNWAGSVTVNNSDIIGNTAEFLGGGIASGAVGFNESGGLKYASLTVNDSSISYNTVLTPELTDLSSGPGTLGGGGGIANFAIGGEAAVASIDNTIMDSNYSEPLPGPTSEDGAHFEHAPGIFNQGTGQYELPNRLAAAGPGGGMGGGILSWSAYDSYAAVDVVESTISGNFAPFAGGGVANLTKYSYSLVNIDSSTVVDNYSYVLGGGVGMFTVYDGGSDYGYTNIDNSTITGNTADFGGNVGVVVVGEPDASRNGGFTEMAVNDATITGGTAAFGGGFYSYASFSAISRTIISGNEASYGAEAYTYYYSPTVATDSYNLFGQNGNAGLLGNIGAGTTDIVPGAGVTIDDILFTALSNTGGPTETHLLMAMGLAVDGVPAGACGPVDDQRGLPRPSGDGCDIGAVELQPPTDVTLTDFSGQSGEGHTGLIATALGVLGLGGWLARRRLKPET